MRIKKLVTLLITLSCYSSWSLTPETFRSQMKVDSEIFLSFRRNNIECFGEDKLCDFLDKEDVNAYVSQFDVDEDILLPLGEMGKGQGIDLVALKKLAFEGQPHTYSVISAISDDNGELSELVGAINKRRNVNVAVKTSDVDLSNFEWGKRKVSISAVSGIKNPTDGLSTSFTDKMERKGFSIVAKGENDDDILVRIVGERSSSPSMGIGKVRILPFFWNPFARSKRSQEIKEELTDAIKGSDMVNRIADLDTLESAGPLSRTFNSTSTLTVKYDVYVNGGRYLLSQDNEVTLKCEFCRKGPKKEDIVEGILKQVKKQSLSRD